MAIEVKDAAFSPTSEEIQLALGLSNVTKSVISDMGLKLAIGNNKILVQSIPTANTLGTVPVSTGAIKLAFKGALGSGSKQHIAELVAFEIKKLQDVYNTHKNGAGAGLADIHSSMATELAVPLSKPAPSTKPKFGVDPAKFKAQVMMDSADALVYSEYTSDKNPWFTAKPTLVEPTTIVKNKDGDFVAKEVHASSSPMPSINSYATTNGTIDLSILQGNVVALKDATQLYQPVKGTSSGSKYFVIAIEKNLKIAARIKGTSLSIRCEGDIHNTWKTQLTANGFTLAEKHASMHVDAPDMIIVRRTIGAVLVGMNLQPTTQLPLIDLIQNKGE